MGIFSFFRKKKEMEIKESIPKEEKLPEISKPEFQPLVKTPEAAVAPAKEKEDVSNLKAKTDLLLTKIESLETRQESLLEKVKNIEKMLNEIYEMAKS